MQSLYESFYSNLNEQPVPILFTRISSQSQTVVFSPQSMVSKQLSSDHVDI